MGPAIVTTSSTVAADDWRALQEGLAGNVVLPGSPEYEVARVPAFPLDHDPRPLAVVRCGADDDVAATITLAGKRGVPAVPRSGGHCFAGRSSTPGVVMDVSPLRSVDVDGDVVTVGAGVRLGDLYDTLASHGLTLPAGCGPTVGIAGLTLGGGLGILGRRYGLTSDRLVAARVVLADGAIVDCDEHHDADLFWALRGAGGGQFAAVTQLAFRGVEAPEVATAFQLHWPHPDKARVIEAWQQWAPDGPDELAASLIVSTGPDPDEPPVVRIFGAMVDTGPATRTELSRLAARVGADPLDAVTDTRPYADTKRYLAELGGPGHPGDTASRSEFFDTALPAGTVEALVGGLTENRIPGQARELDFSPWAGAYARVPAQATAFAHRSARFLLKQSATTAGDRAAATGWLDRSWETTHPWGTGGVYPNFPDPRLTDAPRAYHGRNLERLRRVKATYDPSGFFRFPQSVRASHH